MGQSTRKKRTDHNQKDDHHHTVGVHHIHTSDESKNEDSEKDKDLGSHIKMGIQDPSLKTLSKNELIKRLHKVEDLCAEQDSIIFEMRTLLQSGKGLGDILNMHHLLMTFMAVVRERYNAIDTAVLLMDDINPEDRCFRMRSYIDLPDTYQKGSYQEEMSLFSFPVVDGLLWQILKQGDVFSVQDLNLHPRFKTAWEQWNLGILRSDLWCPLMKKGEVKGILTLGLRADGSQIPESEHEFIQDLASIAVTNVDSVLKYEKNEVILRNVRTLYDINQQLASVNDFKQLCIETLATAVDALDAQKGNLMLLDNATGKLELKVVWGQLPESVRDRINSGEMETKSFSIGEGVAGLCALEKKPIRENDRDNIKQVGNNVVYSMLTVPLLRAGALIGVINMTNKVKIENGEKVLDTQGRFTEEDETLMVGLADQAASNIHKARLYNQSITDKMTGLFNTRHFDFELTRHIEELTGTGQPISLAVSDIDHFKKFNDTYGHKAGDAVLIEVSKKFQEQADKSPNFSAFRYGGEEYCLIMCHTEQEKACEVVDEFRKAVDEMTVEYEGQKLHVTVSIGVSTYPAEAKDGKELFLKADETLYVCKEEGRNQVRGFFGGKKKKLTK